MILLSADSRDKRLKYLQGVRKNLKSHCNSEYLVSLSAHHGTVKSQPLSVGDVVLVVEPAKKHLWTIVWVLELLPGLDGCSREAKIKTATGVLQCPVQ